MERFKRFFLGDKRLLARYVTVGGASAAIEISLFYILFVVLQWPLLLANSLALAITLLFHFNLQKRWTFRDRQSLRKQVPRYLAMILSAALMNNALVFLFVAVLAIPALLAKVLQIGLVFCFTFTASRLVVFAATRQ